MVGAAQQRTAGEVDERIDADGHAVNLKRVGETGLSIRSDHRRSFPFAPPIDHLLRFSLVLPIRFDSASIASNDET